MKKLFTLAAVAMIALTSQANAAERLKVHEVHAFINQLNNAVNNANLAQGYNMLDSMISNAAMIEDNVNGYQNNAYLVNNPYNYSYYGHRYPYMNSYTNVGYASSSKWDKINKLQMKKKTVAGYQGSFEMTNFKISTLADSAVLDIDFKEHSMSYAPGYAPYYYQHASLNTHSKCKMNLGKFNGAVYMTKLYCNTSTNLPL